MIYGQETDVYIAGCMKQGGIYHYRMDVKGGLKFIKKTVMNEPMYMTISGEKMYVVLNSPFQDCNESGVIVYEIDAEGNLQNPSDLQSTKGEVACHISVDDNVIYCVNYVSGSVIKLPDTLVTHCGSGPNLNRQSSPHTHYVGLTPDEKYVCVVDLGLDTIFVYNKDMTLFSKAEVPKGHGARHIVFSKDGKYMFCANELESTLSAFRYNNGNLKLIDTISVLPKDYSGTNTSAAVRVYKNKIYISNRGHNSVSELCFLNEKLNLERTIDCKGKSPRDFDFVNDIMICTNEKSDNVSIFDCKNNFSYIGDYKIEKPLCVVSRAVK